AYRELFVDGLENLLRVLDRQRLRRLIFVSSTGVYHQDDDSWVDEESPTEPTSFSGRRLLEAERLLAQSLKVGTSVRFSGIYGGDRTRLLEQILAGEIDPAVQGPYTNRIHEQDCIGVLEHLVRKALEGGSLESCYLASDCEPVRIADIAYWVREQVGQLTLAANAGAPPRRAGSKRCCNRRLLASGYRF